MTFPERICDYGAAADLRTRLNVVINISLTGKEILSPISSVTKALLMRHLTVYNRFAMIIAVLTVVFVAALAAQVMVLRNTVIEERRTKVFDLVDAAKKILSNYEERAKAGKITAEDARQLAFDAIGAMRWGKSGDYLGIYGAGSNNAGVTYVHANPKYINVNRWDYKDNQGQLLIKNIVGKARSGGGYLTYQVPKAAGGPELPKLTYAGGYGEGDKLLAIQAGVYTDDGRIRSRSRPGSSARCDMRRHGRSGEG
jgi:methyl-accepting chemotaxis protein